MAFPTSPIDGQYFIVNNQVYKYISESKLWKKNDFPTITSIQTTSIAKPTVSGLYIFTTVVPSDGLPSNVNLNDVAFYDGVTWSLFANFSDAPSNIMVGQTQWHKDAGTWGNVIQIQSDWSQTDNTKADYVKNKPVLSITNIISTGGTVPTTSGNYIFIGVPNGDYPSGTTINNLYNFDGVTTWTLVSNYSNLPNTLITGSGANQNFWYKQSGTWNSQYKNISLTNSPTDITLAPTTTVDIGDIFEINQTNPDVNITLPVPTNTKNAKRITFINTGTVQLMLNKYIVSPNNFISFIWSPSKNAWINLETQRLKLSYVDRLALTAYDEMVVYQKDGNVQGDWKYNGALSAWIPQNFNKPIDGIMTTVTTKPTVNGVYIFNVTPTDSLPSGIALYDIASLYNGTWYKVFSYANAPTSVMVGTQEYIKNAGTWVKVVDDSSTQTLTNKSLTSPTLTGTPTAPTATAGTNTTQIATTAFIVTAISTLTKASVGLGNVDNTSDANKPISSATQTALNAKLNSNMISDHASSGYYDIGSMRIQWGYYYGSGQEYVNVNFPVSFINTSYSITTSINTNGSAIFSIGVYGQSTTGFAIRKRFHEPSTANYGGATTETFNWIAIGLKP